MEHKWRYSRLSNYNSAIKTARKKYFFNIIAESYHNPWILLWPIQHVNGPKNNSFPYQSSKACENFSTFFTAQIEKRVRLYHRFVTSLLPTHPPTVSFPSFQLISLQTLLETVCQFNCSSCHRDAIPSRLFKELPPRIFPIVLSIINCSLANGYVLSFSSGLLCNLFSKK